MSAESTTGSPDLGKRHWRQSWCVIAKSWRLPKRNNLRRTPSPMASERLIGRYRGCYAKLLRLYPQSYRSRFGTSMEQTFNDLCRERVEAGRGLLSLALWVFVETLAAIIWENATIVMRCIMNRAS